MKIKRAHAFCAIIFTILLLPNEIYAKPTTTSTALSQHAAESDVITNASNQTANNDNADNDEQQQSTPISIEKEVNENLNSSSSGSDADEAHAKQQAVIVDSNSKEATIDDNENKLNSTNDEAESLKKDIGESTVQNDAKQQALIVDSNSKEATIDDNEIKLNSTNDEAESLKKDIGESTSKTIQNDVKQQAVIVHSNSKQATIDDNEIKINSTNDEAESLKKDIGESTSKTIQNDAKQQAVIVDSNFKEATIDGNEIKLNSTNDEAVSLKEEVDESKSKSTVQNELATEKPSDEVNFDNNLNASSAKDTKTMHQTTPNVQISAENLENLNKILNEINKNETEMIKNNLTDSNAPAAIIQLDESENKIQIDGKHQLDEEDRLERAEYAKRMLTYMNQSIDPCDDFYEYACGNWKNTLVERQSPHKRNNLLDIGFELADMVEGLLESPAERLLAKYGDELNRTRIFQQSCLQADVWQQKKSADYLEVINAIGGFPALDETWQAEQFNWFNTSAHLSRYGGGGLVNEDIVPQYPFPPYFKLLELGFDLIVHSDNIRSNATRGYKLNEQRMRGYLTAYGVNETKISAVIDSIFELWHAILNVTDEFNEDIERCRELGAAKNITEWPQWQNYFDIAWDGIDFDEDETTECPCAYLYTRIDEICNERKEAVANYLAMKFLYRMDARLENKEFQREFCNLKIRSSLTFLIDQLYMEKYFHPEIRIEVSEITKEIREIFRETLVKLDWLDEETRTQALLKESAIESRIGSFEDNRITERLIREIGKLDFDENNYEKNNIEITKFRQYMKRYNGLHFKELMNDTKPLELLIGMQVNAFYYNIDNSINVMAGILHPPAYHKSWPFSLKYGTLGYLIGHEFTHGFDTVGAFYDGKGTENHWWSEKSEKIFDERTDCYVKKFNEYVIPEIKRNIDGNQTKDENIADNGGLRNALSAYHHYIKKELSSAQDPSKMSILKQEHMPGMDLTPEQLFFLGFAQLWCADYKEEHFWEELTNQHTIDKYRVLGALSNVEDFADAYNCPIGSRMNPKPERCELW